MDAIAAQAKRNHIKADSSQEKAMTQRKCACGQHTVAGGECQACRQKRLKLQRWHKGHTGLGLLANYYAASSSSVMPRFDTDFTRVPLRTPTPPIQRLPRGEVVQLPEETAAPLVETAAASSETPSAAPETTTAEPASEPATSETTAMAALLVADEATELGPGQMRKSDFLAELRTAVCAAADAELTTAGRDTEGCPYLSYWFDYYEQREAAHVERALRRYAPSARDATSASAYIPIVAERVRQGVARWVRTGDMSGVPEGIPLMVPTGGIGGLLAGVGSLFFKARPGGAKEPDDPHAVQAQLGHGRTLDSGVRVRMESAFGTSFSHVRLHNDSHAAGLSSNLNARAFTVGEHVAFGAGEYQPGSPLGDALIAHELAHVVQQRGAGASVAPMEMGNAHDAALEKDADDTAVDTVMALHGGRQNLAEAAGRIRPALRTGLQLQRCASTPARRETLPEPLPVDQAASGACSADERQSMERFNPCCTASMLREIGILKAQAIPILQGAVNTLTTSPGSVEGHLWEHFRIRPNDSRRLPQVSQQLSNMLSKMQGHETIYGCRDKNEDPMCRPDSIFPVRASTSPTCTASGPYYLHFCADYTDAARSGGTYLTGGNWRRTFIHEYAHIGCSAATPIYPANTEFYRNPGGSYPVQNPDRMIQNADCYAWFAMAVRDRAASGPPPQGTGG